MDRTECVVVGAGVVGLAVARALARSGREVIVLEREGLIGSHTSSRNSEVIHAGIYYPRDSAKARLCVRGKALLYDHCASRGVPHRRIGKIIVATGTEQLGALDAAQAAARGNGVEDLTPLDAADLARLEPDLVGVAGLMSPSTGIIDSHALMLSYLGEAEDHGAMLALNARLTRATPLPGGGFEIEVDDGRRDHAARDRAAGQRRRAVRRRGRGGDRGAGGALARARCSTARAPISPPPAGCRSRG